MAAYIIFGADLGNLGNFLDFAHEHHLGGVDVSFGANETCPTSAIINFNMPDI